jgi:hypothetical protein
MLPTPALASVIDDGIDLQRALFAAEPTPGRALAGDHPALGAKPLSGHPVLLLEPAEAVTLVNPVSGDVREMQAEILIRQGFQRLGTCHADPGQLDGWSLSPAHGRLSMRDSRRNVWASTSVRPPIDWLTEAARLGSVLIVYGALVGVQPPRGLGAAEYGDRQRAVELAAGRARGFVAAVRIAWVS